MARSYTLTEREQIRHRGEQMREARQKIGMTVAFVAEGMGVAEFWLEDLEAGKFDPSIFWMMTWADVTGIGWGLDHDTQLLEFSFPEPENTQEKQGLSA